MIEQTYLIHYGVQGMRWGHRKDPGYVSDRDRKRLAKFEKKELGKSRSSRRVVNTLEKKKLLGDRVIADKNKAWDNFDAYYRKQEVKIQKNPKHTEKDYYNLDEKMNKAANAIESRFIKKGMAAYDKLDTSQKVSVMKDIQWEDRKRIIGRIGGVAAMAAPLAIWLLDHK